MSKLFQFRCDSCNLYAEAKFNGEHYLPPKGWCELIDTETTCHVAHLCDVCSCTLLHHSLRENFRKWRKKQFKGCDSNLSFGQFGEGPYQNSIRICELMTQTGEYSKEERERLKRMFEALDKQDKERKEQEEKEKKAKEEERRNRLPIREER